jgi:Tfp pilus assembly protein PilF
LVNADDGAYLWAERYDRDLTDIFAIQNEIGQAISEALNLRLAPRAQTVNIQAYQNYLKGQFYRQRLTPETAAKAKECFGRALAINPRYAAAHSGLASYYQSLAVLTTERSSDIAPLAKSAAEKALAIDPANSEAHSILATVAGIVDYEWKASEAHFRKALAVEPVPPMVRFRYAWYYLLAWGRIAEAKEQSQLGLETDPLSMFLHSTMTASMYFAKQYPEAIEYGKRALEIDAHFYSVWFLIGLAQVSAGLAQEAISSFSSGVELAPWYPEGQWYLAAAYHLVGDCHRSVELTRKLADQHGHTLGAASFHAVVGDVERMTQALEGAYSQRDPRLHFVSKRPIFDSYRADPRLQGLLHRMNLT